MTLQETSTLAARRSTTARRIIAFWLPLCVGLVGFAHTALAATYYVAENGNDATGVGSIGSPWRAPQFGAQQLRSGDTLYIRAGTYNVPSTSHYIPAITTVQRTTQAFTSLTTIAAYPGETVVLDGGAGPTNATIGTYNQDYVSIDGFVIKGQLVFWASNNSRGQNNDVSIGADNESGNGFGDVLRVQRCSNILIRNNRLHDNVDGTGGTSFNQSLSVIYTSDHVVYENNELYNSRMGGFWLKDSTQDITVRYNYIHDNPASGIQQANQVTNGANDNTAIYQNIFANNNSSNGSGGGALSLLWQATGIKIYNNTFYGNLRASIVHSVGGSTLDYSLWNNISVSPTQYHVTILNSATIAGNMLFNDYNDYYGTASWFFGGAYATLSAWQSACQAGLTGCEAHSLVADPGFVNDSGSFGVPSDFKRTSYPTNGRGGSYASVMGAYITGSECIGLLSACAPPTCGNPTTCDVGETCQSCPTDCECRRPAAPANLRIE